MGSQYDEMKRMLAEMENLKQQTTQMSSGLNNGSSAGQGKKK
jgi:hypothetical protein